MSRRKRRQPQLIARYECLGCGRTWGEDLRKIAAMRASGELPATYSGTHCPCGHPYIKWLNYDEIAKRLR